LLAAAIALALVVAAAVGSGGAAAASPPPRPVPAGFFGVVPDAALSAGDWTKLGALGLSDRFQVIWAEVEPEPGRYEWSTVDAIVGEAATHGVQLMPEIYGSPGWVAPEPARPPLGTAQRSAWTQFLRALVHRYGPGGEFWAARSRKLPIRRWQIWNEPNFRLFWAPRIEPAGYAKLLHASATTIRRADPGAKIVLAGIAPVGAGLKTWVFMRRFLQVPGVRRDFNFAALHPYSATLPELDYQLERVRAAMAAGGAGRKPLIVTEFGVASDGGYPSAFVLGVAGQARFLHRAYSQLLAMRHRWRIAGAYWFTWQDAPKSDPHCGFCQGAGLFRLDGSAKPAWHAYRHIVNAAGAR
jgi:hypothetical protein